MNMRRFVHKTRKDLDLAEEIESHLAHEEDSNIAGGLTRKKPGARRIFVLEIRELRVNDCGAIAPSR
jgi:hypothetical protein